MNPMLLSLLMSFGPALLSKLFGGNQREDLIRRIAALSSPGNLAGLTSKFYQQAIASPAYSQAQGEIGAGANQAAGNIAGSLGARGISGSGLGAILSGLTPSLVGHQMAQLRTGAYQGAQSEAEGAVQKQVQALMGTYGQPSMTQGLLGGGLAAFGPLFQAWLKSKYPEFGGVNPAYTNAPA